MDMNAIETDNSIICVNWADLYSEMLMDAGIDSKSIIIQRLYDSDGKIVPGTHASIFVQLSDGSIIMPDLTAPLGTYADFYNVKVGNETSGFVLFTPEQVQEIANLWETKPIKDLNYTVKNYNAQYTDLNVSKQYENFVNYCSSFMFGMEFSTTEEANLLGELVGYDFIADEEANNKINRLRQELGDAFNFNEAVKQLELTNLITKKKARINREKLFFDHFKNENKARMATLDETVNGYLSVSDFFIKQLNEDARISIKENDINKIELGCINEFFLGLDNVNNKNMITLLSYMKDMARQEGLLLGKEGLQPDTAKIVISGPAFVSENQTIVTIDSYYGLEKTGTFQFYIGENGNLVVNKVALS